MTKEEIYEAVTRMIFEDGGNLNKSDYEQLLSDIAGVCNDALVAMESDEE